MRFLVLDVGKDSPAPEAPETTTADVAASAVGTAPAVGAAKAPLLPLVELLLAWDPDVTARMDVADKHGNTAAHMVCWQWVTI